jgi:phosphoglycolate phosphatase-like HAD superfamily hydrolase
LSRKVALLDIDGTLIDSVPLHEFALNRAVKRYGYELSEGAMRGKSTDFKLAELLVPLSLWHLIKEVKQEAFEELLEDTSIWTNKSEYYSLVQEGYAVAFCTQSNEASARAVLRRLGLWHENTILFAGQNKKDPRALKRILKQLGYLPEEALMVDDSLEVCEIAKSIGMTVKHVAGPPK